MDSSARSEDRPSAPRRRARRRILALGAAVALAILLPYAVIDPEPTPIDDAARAAKSGRIATLPSGRTWYEVHGPETGAPVVLVHGTTIPSLVWDRNADALAGAGFHVIRYDLYGRGLSDRPDARYDLDVYVTQLAELLDALAPGRPVDLVGLSLGGMIVAEFARRHPHQVRRLVLIGPGGVADPPTIARAAAAPGVGEYLMRVAGSRQLLPSRRMLLHPDRHAALDSAFLATIRFRGSRRAVLATLRNVPYNGYQEAYAELGRLGKPVMLVWGREDVVVPFASSEVVRALVHPARFVAVDDAGHLANLERPDVVNAATIDFLSR